MRKSIFLILAGILSVIIVYASDFFPSKKTLNGASVNRPGYDTLPGIQEETGSMVNDNPWVEVARLYDLYHPEAGTTITGTIKYIDTVKRADIKTLSFEFSGNTKRFYYKIGNTEFAGNEKVEIVADHGSRILKYSGRKGIQEIGPPDLGMFKNMLKSSEASIAIYREGTSKILVIDNIEHPQIEGYRIYYRMADYRISKILVAIAAQESDSKQESGAGYHYAEMSYETKTAMQVPFSMFHPEEIFIKPHVDTLMVTDAYKDFQLITIP